MCVCLLQSQGKNYRKCLPSNNKELALLAWFTTIFIFTASCLVAFTVVNASSLHFYANQFQKDTNILEWGGVFWTFVYFLGYSVLFCRHPIGDEMAEQYEDSFKDPTHDPGLII